jgi:hypothetical protein
MTLDGDLLRFILWVCFGGWCLYLSAERGRIVSDIKDQKHKIEELEKAQGITATTLQTGYLTKEEHKDFDNRISKSIDKLSDRIDQVLQKILMNYGKE